jgi:hypothetical protein
VSTTAAKSFTHAANDPEQRRRLPAPRAVLSPRSRFAPLAIALPLVLGLWLTIGLPIFAELSDTAGGNGAMRDFFFDADASGATGGNGGDRGPSSPGLSRRRWSTRRSFARYGSSVSAPGPRPTSPRAFAPHPPPPRGAGAEPATRPAPGAERGDLAAQHHGADAPGAGSAAKGHARATAAARSSGSTASAPAFAPSCPSASSGARVRFEGAGDDALTVRDPFDAALSELGSIQANRDWASSAEFTGSQMTLSGSTITIVLGTLSGTSSRDPSAKALVWTTPYGTATESGHADSNF